MFLFSPLEQFQISVFDWVMVVFSNSGLFLLLVLCGNLLWFQSFHSLKVVPGYSQSLVESLNLFVCNLVTEQMGSKGWKFYGRFLLTLFIMVLGFNLVGLIRYTFTVTSHMAISLGCSIGMFLGTVIVGLWVHQESYFDMFLRMGVRLALQRVLIYIEILGFIAKSLSLGVSLTANMLAGHTLMKLTSMLVWGVFMSSGMIQSLFVIPFIGLLLLTGLEIVMSFVQAYVFIVLTCSVLPN